MNLWLLVVLSVVTTCLGETFRISEVLEKDDAEAVLMKLEAEGRPSENLLVSKRVIVADQDIKTASATREGVHVDLNEAGTAKLVQATENMIPGRQRLAVIVEGRLVSAPVIMSRLGGSFEISGLRGLGEKRLDDLARKMSGLAVRPEREIPPGSPERKSTQLVPYTEEEYRVIKERRRLMGIHHIEKVPDETELNKILRRGMVETEVIKLFGEPGYRSPNTLSYDLAPEKRPDNPERLTYLSGFSVSLESGKVQHWSSSWSDAPREMKDPHPAKEPGLLKATLPPVDASAENLDPVALLEGIKVADVATTPANKTDLLDLYGLIVTFSNSPREAGGKEIEVDPACHLVVVLSRHVPEVAKIQIEARESGRLPLKKLRNAMEAHFNRSAENPARQKD
jgi:hypothetical protein